MTGMPTPPKYPPKSLDDMPLAAYGGSGMEDEGATPTEPNDPAAPVVAAMTATPTPPTAPPASVAFAATPAPPAAPGADLPIPEDERPPGPSLVARIITLFRTSRIAAGAGFAAVIVVGLLLLSGGGNSPGATAATPSKGPTAPPVVVPASGDASVTVTGAVTGTFQLTGLAGGQHIEDGTVALAWGDAQQTTLSITGPLDRGTRLTDERLVLTLGVLVNAVPVTFTSNQGECTVGMAQVGTKVQGSITCHKLKGPDGKLSIEVSGSYRS
jgi:hypothetical protein